MRNVRERQEEHVGDGDKATCEEIVWKPQGIEGGKHTPFFRDNCRLGDIPGIEDRRVSAIPGLTDTESIDATLFAARRNTRSVTSIMPTQSKMIARSPSPPEPDDSEEVWPVYGIVGEDVDVFGNSRYVLRADFTTLQTLIQSPPQL